SRRLYVSSSLPDPGQRVRLADWNSLSNYQGHSSATSQHHQCRIQSRVTAADHRHMLTFVVTDLWHLVIDILGVQLIEGSKTPRIMKKSARNDDFAAQITSLGRDHPLQVILGLNFLGILDRQQFFIEAKLNKGIRGLTKGAFGEFFAAD